MSKRCKNCKHFRDEHRIVTRDVGPDHNIRQVTFAAGFCTHLKVEIGRDGDCNAFAMATEAKR